MLWQRYFLPVLFAVSVSFTGAASKPASASEAMYADFRNLMQRACIRIRNGLVFDNNLLASVQPEKEPVVFRGVEIGERYFYQLDQQGTARLDLLVPVNQPARFVFEYRDEQGNPTLFIGMDNECTIRQARKLIYEDGKAVSLEHLDDEFKTRGNEPLNPPLPKVPPDTHFDGLRVAMVDSGVNYLLPEISSRLASDANGKMLGYDFWDMDEQPFDAQIAGSPFFVQRHGTRTAALLLKENPEVSLVSYRYPRNHLERMSALVSHVAGLGVRVIGLPLGSNNENDWTAFANAANQHSDILFVVSAGNNGRNIDLEPLYPASLDIENMLVVSSADDFGRAASRTNWGKLAVDYLLPAERVRSMGFDGKSRDVSGSSYAVSRMVALAARILSADTTMAVSELVKKIDGLIEPSYMSDQVSRGYIPDPLADIASYTLDDQQASNPPVSSASQNIALQLVRLDPSWSQEVADIALEQAREILSQCDIGIHLNRRIDMQGNDYLSDLSSSSGYTVMGALNKQYGNVRPPSIRLVLARDSRMQQPFDAEAFGKGNTRTRPWLENSIWLVNGGSDPGIAIAHEIYHILANDGSHVPGPKNLMRDKTDPAATELTVPQCLLAQQFFSQ